MVIDELTLLTNIDQKLGEIVNKLNANDNKSESDIEAEESRNQSDSMILLETQV